MSHKSTAFLLLRERGKHPDDEVARGKYEAYCEKVGIDSNKFWQDLYLPRFRCDNKLKVFVSFFSAGVEIKTEGEIPIAYLINKANDKLTNLGEENRKTLMVSGERTYLTFSIPDEAKSWEVWVPK